MVWYAMIPLTPVCCWRAIHWLSVLNNLNRYIHCTLYVFHKDYGLQLAAVCLTEWMALFLFTHTALHIKYVLNVWVLCSAHWAKCMLFMHQYVVAALNFFWPVMPWLSSCFEWHWERWCSFCWLPVGWALARNCPPLWVTNVLIYSHSPHMQACVAVYCNPVVGPIVCCVWLYVV